MTAVVSHTVLGRSIARPRPLAELPAALCTQVLGLMTDIDDTLTCDGAIEPAALGALHDLYDANVAVVAITGRPLGWSEPFARAWPVAAIVAENGAVALIRDGRSVCTEFVQNDTTRHANARRLQHVAQQVLREVPGAQLAQDSAGRVTDIAIDHSEFTRLPAAQIEAVVQIMRGSGMHATVSSIHVNGWYGEHNKWTAAQWMLQRLFKRDLSTELDRWVYVGDSTNDQLMFEHFPLSVGVANLMRFADQLQVWPVYMSQAERGQGFAEVARAVINANSSAVRR